MKPMNFALVALAGFGLVTSQVAFADTLPAAAMPAVTAPVAGHVHAAKIVRLTEKRKGAASDAFIGEVTPLGVVIGFTALGAVIYGVVEATKSSTSPGT